jgi:hypothetical protein
VYKRRHIGQRKQNEAASAHISLRKSATSRFDKEIERQDEYRGEANQTQTTERPVFPEADDDAQNSKHTPNSIGRSEVPSFGEFGGRIETLEHRCIIPSNPRG